MLIIHLIEVNKIKTNLIDIFQRFSGCKINKYSRKWAVVLGFDNKSGPHQLYSFAITHQSNLIYQQVIIQQLLPLPTTSMPFLLTLLFLLILNAHSSNIFTLSQIQHTSYAQWKSAYAKSYQSGEVEAYRLSLWVQNYNKIEMHNAKYREGNVSFYVATNQLSDFPLDQVIDTIFYDNIDYQTSSSVTSPSLTEICSLSANAPTTQVSKLHFSLGVQFGQLELSPSSHICASGWAMATSKTLSISLSNMARLMKKSQVIISLSPQQVVDCGLRSLPSPLSGLGCRMGSISNAWKYYKQSGAVLNSIYPLTNSVGSCQAGASGPAFTISGCQIVPSNSQRQLRNAVALTPVTVQINGKAFNFLYYAGGIYDGGDCYQDDYQFNHALTVIGFDYQIDFDENGEAYNTPYWQLSNSFGTSWGENGYIRMLRQEEDDGPGPCGMYDHPTYPVL